MLRATLVFSLLVGLSPASPISVTEASFSLNPASPTSVTETNARSECYICAASYNSGTGTWVHLHAHEAPELCDTPEEREANSDCESCGQPGYPCVTEEAEAGDCEDGPCDLSLAQAIDAQLIEAYEKQDATVLASILIHHEGTIAWNGERGVIQTLGSCGNVVRQVPLSSALSEALEESLASHQGTLSRLAD